VITPRQRCPCHSGLTYGACCRPVHRGERDPMPEQLMRARFSAYALGKVAFVQDTTTHPRDDRDAWTAEIEQFCEAVEFAGLQILLVEPGDREAWVTFRADLRAGATDVGFAERSRFEHHGRWTYADGERLPP
jgi:SEC-C motif-containing protein